MRHSTLLLCLAALATASCSKGSGNDDTSGATGGNAVVPEVYRKIYGATSITSDGTWVTVRCKGLPDHKSPYYPTNNPLNENFSGTTFGGVTFEKNPNSIAEKNYVFKIPLSPKEASSKQPTPLGPIGVSLNGVPFFNQYAGPNRPLTGEIVSFDRYWGHPAPGGLYHYHVEPLFLTLEKVGKSALLGFLLDGFPVYGPMENGNPVAESSLDAYHGHSHSTTDFPNGIYHYHVTNNDPYINGNGFFGTPGTVSQ